MSLWTKYSYTCNTLCDNIISHCILTHDIINVVTK